jgi:predicted dehydrogenase
MRTPAPVRFGLVGAGRIAWSYVQALARSAHAELAAVADVRDEAAVALAESAGCRSFASHAEMAQSAALDAAIVCTPPATHAAICTDLVRSGLHVLCEKPFAIRSDEGRGMVEAARRAGVILTMASKFRFVEDVVRARSLVASGLVGEVVLAENAFTARVDMARRWNSDAAQSGGGVLIDNGTHSLDLLRFFLGELADLQVVEGPRTQGLAVEETVHVFVRGARGSMGVVDLSWSIDKDLPSYLDVHGGGGTVSVGWKTSRYRLASSRDWVEFGRGYDKLQAFVAQIDNFTAAVRGDEPLVITSADALASVAAVEAAYRSLGRDGWTAIPGRVEEAV